MSLNNAQEQMSICDDDIKTHFTFQASFNIDRQHTFKLVH